MVDRNVKVVLSLIASGYESGMAKAKQSTDSLITSLGQHQQAAQQVGTAMMTAGAAILAGVGLATKAYADFDKQMSSVKSTGADAVKNFDALREAAVRAGSQTAFSATEAAQGIEELAKAGLTSADILSGGLDGALSLAAAGMIGVGLAAEITAVTLKQFGLDGTQASRVADVLAAGAGKAVGEVSDMAAALKMSGTVAAQYGLTLEETVGSLALFANNALIGSDAGTSMKAMLLQLASPTKQAQEALDAYNISAYDAQGQFVGMAALADQLKTNLGGLSQEQQNAALKTIFGADAIRVATVLMKEGGDAVREWTIAVAEQGFAAEMAKTKLDNLAGDAEALGGAFESLFIRSGSGMNDFLRGLTQGATEVVNAFGMIPAPVLSAGLVLAGLVGSGMLAVGTLIKVGTTAAELRTSITTLATVFPKAASAVAAFGTKLSAVGWAGAIGGAVALTAAMIALAAAQKQNQDAFDLILTAADDLGPKLIRTSDAAKTLNEAFTLDTVSFSGVTREVDGLGDALKRVLAADFGQKFEDFLNGLVLGGSAADQMRKQFSELDSTLTAMVNSGNGELAAQQFRLVEEAAKAQGIPIEQLAALFPQYSGALRVVAGEAGKTATNSELLAQANRGLAEASTEAVNALVKQGNAMLSLSGSQIGFEASLDAATEAINKHGEAVLDAAGDIDIGSEKGQQLKAALDGVANSALSVIDNMIKTGATTQEISAFQQRAAQDFLATADSMGLSSGKAIELARDYGLIPRDVATAVTAPGAELSRQQTLDLISALGKVPGLTNAQVLAPGARPSKDEVDVLIARLGAVPGMTEAEIRTIADLYGVQRAEAAIAAVKSKTVTISVAYKSIGGANIPVADGGMFAATSAGLVQQYADGGFHSTIGAQQPQIRPAGGAGIRWAEDGAGPWEAFISGHPAKRRRSRWLLEETARRLGGIVSWETAYADGGIHYASNYSPPVRTTSGASGSMRLHPSDLRALAGAIAERPVQVLPVVRDKDLAAAVREANRGVR